MNDEFIETLEETEVNLRFPTKVSQLENDLNYQTDTQVAATVATEATARETADQSLSSDIATEASAREAADTTLSANITAEANARESADQALTTSIASETTARESADQTLTSSIASEAATRESADTALSTRITTNANAITSESTARQGADANLQSQIDAISASSDVTDIVGTYAQLQAYDTSTLGDNDIIKVLQDEQHDGETTYYRWSTTTQTFALIGEEGPYYTKSAADTKFQEKLIPGTNVTIGPDGKTISATDTTYSNFTGTDGQTAGAAGLVPAPATTDANKVLGAGGSWVDGLGTATFWGQTANNGVVSGDILLGANLGRDGVAKASVEDTRYDAGVSVTEYTVGEQVVRTRLYAEAKGTPSNTGTTLTLSSSPYDGASLNANLSMGNNKVTGLGTPTANTDAATKAYVDGQVGNIETVLQTLNSGTGAQGA